MQRAALARILVVDDEKDIANLLKIELDFAGFATEVAYRPSEALEKFRAGHFDLLVVDVKMPGMDGFALYEKLSELDPAVRVCFLTAFTGLSDAVRQRFARLQGGCIIEKPATRQEVLQAVAKALERGA
jgi:DNA-binding response OmpR family regulator